MNHNKPWWVAAFALGLSLAVAANAQEWGVNKDELVDILPGKA